MSTGPGANDATPGDRTATGLYAADLPPGTVLANRFRLEGLLGVGGMGVVYRATDLDLGIPVAVKMLRPEMAERPGAFERFRQELLLSRQVSSAHVLRIHDIARHGDRWLISMDLVDGEPLDRWLDTRAPLPVEQALGIARQIALGLAAAHAGNVVHRDLKPANILIDADGHARIGDFGIARSMGTSGLTATGVVVGTPDYLSPEQARAQPVDARSDVYALGLLLYEMLAGQPAFHGSTASESLALRMVGAPPAITTVRKDVPGWVGRLLDRLLRSNPAHRLQTADAVVRAIDAREVPRDFRPGARSWLALGAAAVLGGGLWFAMNRAPSTPATVAAALPTPDRVVVLPIATVGGGIDEETADGASELLRYATGADDAVTVVDGARVEQAVAQLRTPAGDASAVDGNALRALLPARRLLRTQLRRDGRLWRATGRLEDDAGHATALPSTSAGSRVGALAGLSRTVRAALAAAPADAAGMPPGVVDTQAEGGRAADLAALFPRDDAGLSAYGHALALQRRGRVEDAAVAFAALTQDAAHLAPAWLGRAQLAFASGRPDDAAEAAATGLELRAGARMQRALSHWQALSGAVPPAEALAAHLEFADAHADDLDARYRLAQLQAHANEVPPALKTLRALLARDPNDPRAWFLLGKTAILHGDLREAVDDYLVRALVQYKRGRNAYGEAETVNALGVAYSRLGQAGDAREQFTKAVSLRRALGDRRGVASSLRNLAQLSTVQGDFVQAKAQLDEARVLFAAVGDAGGLDAVDNELGLLAEERGDFAAANVAFRRMLRARELAGDAAGVAESLNNVGFAQFALGAYDDANAYWQQALAAFGALDDAVGRGQVQQNLGALGIARGQWAQARQLLDASITIASRQQMVEETAVSRFHLAQLNILEGRFDAAAQELERAARLFEERDDRRGRIEVALARGQLLFATGDDAGLERQLATLATLLADASAEQRAGAALLRGDLAERLGDFATAAAARGDARGLADASGMRALRLRARIASHGAQADAVADAALDAELAALGNVGLQLAWQERKLRDHLAAGKVAVAVDDYASARIALRGRETIPAAATLHALGALAESSAGHGTAASTARAEAARVAGAIARTLPPAQRTRYLAAAGPGLGGDVQAEAVADGR